MIDFHFFKKLFTTYNYVKFKTWRKKINKGIKKKELNHTSIKLGKKLNDLKTRIFRDIKNLFEQEKGQENYYKTVRGF